MEKEIKPKKSKFLLYFFLFISVVIALIAILVIAATFEFTWDVNILIIFLTLYVFITSGVIVYRIMMKPLSIFKRLWEIKKEVKIEIGEKKVKITWM